MSLIEITLEGQRDKVQMAIDLLRDFEPPEGYFLAFSGGKDSCVVKALCDMAGVKYDAHYNVTSVDPPELVRFIRKNHPDVMFDVPRYDDGRPVTMWNLIPRKRMPPTRLARYCCAVLKESTGKGRKVLTGVRWAEGVNRAKKQGLIRVSGSKGNKAVASEMGIEANKYGDIVFNDDNAKTRTFLERCVRTGKMMVNPIVAWSDDDVWEFIKSYNVAYCDLYDKGYKRLGCIGCPISTNAEKELEAYPKYKDAYLRAFQRMLDEYNNKVQWKTPEDVMDWWLGKKPSSHDTQLSMFDIDESEVLDNETPIVGDDT